MKRSINKTPAKLAKGNADPQRGPIAALSAKELERFCDFLYRQTGMMFGESKRYYIDRRIAEGMEEAGIADFESYFALVRQNPRELEKLINNFTINETYFYRERYQLQCLTNAMLPEIIGHKAPGDLIRIWSVPCSTGEEPYSVALWLLENWRLVDAYNVEIIGSDIDTRVLADAMAGVYGARSLSHLDQDLLNRYFEPSANGNHRIIQDLRESVKFTRVNLVDTESMAAQGGFDVIFCRNVLIYFDDTSRLTAAKSLYNCLRPGGFICFGHTESMSRVYTKFVIRRFEDAMVFQRPFDR